ncbi:MAG: LUD domain-containing protein [Pseudomonadota bacterium]
MSASDAEREIFARVRGASSKAAPEFIHRELAELVQPIAAPAEGSSLETFVERIQRNGATLALAQNRQEAIAEVARFVTERHGQRRIVAGHDPRLAALPWRDGGLLPRFGEANGEDRVGVSYATAAIAETGSLALWLNRENPALNNLLVEDHIVIVDGADVLDRLEDLWASKSLRDGSRRPRGLMMISGPSSTADIAMKLVLGAHGPRALHVIVMDKDQR